MFDGHYDIWRVKRIEKILSVFPRESFQSKKILELAAGFGANGKIFESFGANVTYAEGLRQNFDRIVGNKILLDQDKKWNLNETFDFIIHWGVLYHLDNWQQDLECALNHTNCIFLESEVSDSDDPNFEIKTQESGYDQALNRIGSRPSANKIENFLLSKGAKFTRYDDSDLTADFHCYDWKVTNSNTWRHGLRRFWIVTR